MKKLLNSPLFNIGLLAILTFFVFKLTLEQNLEETLQIISEAHWGWLSLSFLSVLFMFYVWGLGIQAYTNLIGGRINSTQALNIALIGAFGSGITPSATGGQLFQAVAFRRLNIRYAQAASILWLDFLLYQMVMITMVFILLVLKLSSFLYISGLFTMVLFGFLLNSLVLVVLFVLAKSQRLHHWLSSRGIYSLHRLKLVKDPQESMKKLESSLQRFRDSMALLLQNKKVMIIGVITNVIRLILYFFLPYLIAKALRAPILRNDIYNMIALSSFVMMINVFIPLPGASGGTELTFLSMFATIVDQIYLSPLVLIWRFLSYYLIIIVGALIFLYYKRRAI